MPITTNLDKFELLNQFRNGNLFAGSTSEFAGTFVACVGETVQASYELDISWYAAASPGDEWQVEALAVERAVGSFSDDGFAVGQTFEYFADWATSNSTGQDFVGEITAITLSGKRITFTVSSGTVTTGATTTAGIQAQADLPANMPDAAILRFNLLPNGSTFSNTSELTGTAQAWYASGIDVAGGTVSNMQKVGSFSGWLTGSATIERNGTGPTKNQATYKIVHTFQVLPFYEIGYLPNLQNGTVPALWQSELNYLFEVEFRSGLNNTASAKVARPALPAGETAWFEQAPGGFYSRYSITSVSYEDTATGNPVASVQIDKKTTTTFTATRLGVPGSTAGFSVSEKVFVYIAYLPEQQSEYQQTPTTLAQNFVFDQLPAFIGDPANTGTGVIKRCEATVSAGVVTVEVDTEYNSAQQVQIGAGASYMLFVQVGDTTLTVANTDRTMLVVDAAQYTGAAFIEGLATWTKFNTLTHPRALGAATGVDSAGSVNQWDEDGILVDFGFELDTTKNSKVDGLTIALVAYKTADDSYFLLDTYTYNLAGGVTSQGVQQYNISASRGYLLRAGDQFNFVKLTTGTAGAGTQGYTGAFAQKIKWQDWLLNPAADPVFFDPAETNDNLNYKSDNYSGVNGYEVRVLAILDLTGENDNGIQGIGRETKLSATLDLFDYGISDDGNWSGQFTRLTPTTRPTLTRSY